MKPERLREILSTATKTISPCQTWQNKSRRCVSQFTWPNRWRILKAKMCNLCTMYLNFSCSERCSLPQSSLRSEENDVCDHIENTRVASEPDDCFAHETRWPTMWPVDSSMESWPSRSQRSRSLFPLGGCIEALRFWAERINRPKAGWVVVYVVSKAY